MRNPNPNPNPNPNQLNPNPNPNPNQLNPNSHRDTLATYVGNPSLLAYFATAEGESIGFLDVLVHCNHRFL